MSPRRDRDQITFLYQLVIKHVGFSKQCPYAIRLAESENWRPCADYQLLFCTIDSLCRFRIVNISFSDGNAVKIYPPSRLFIYLDGGGVIPPGPWRTEAHYSSIRSVVANALPLSRRAASCSRCRLILSSSWRISSSCCATLLSMSGRARTTDFASCSLRRRWSVLAGKSRRLMSPKAPLLLLLLPWDCCVPAAAAEEEVGGGASGCDCDCDWLAGCCDCDCDGVGAVAGVWAVVEVPGRVTGARRRLRREDSSVVMSSWSGDSPAGSARLGVCWSAILWTFSWSLALGGYLASGRAISGLGIFFWCSWPLIISALRNRPGTANKIDGAEKDGIFSINISVAALCELRVVCAGDNVFRCCRVLTSGNLVKQLKFSLAYAVAKVGEQIYDSGGPGSGRGP
jgi:hypothetical protein